MKLYNDYIDNISVNDALHLRIMAGVTTKPQRRITVVTRYGAAFACVAVVLLSLLMIPKLLPSDTISPPENPNDIIEPTDTEPGVTAPIDTQPSYTIVFNKATGMMSADIGKTRVSGHFWEKLADEAVAALFPKLAYPRTLTATANFSGSGTLFNIEALCTNGHNGIMTYITIQEGAVTLDYIVPDEPAISDVYGIPVTAGYWKNGTDTHYYASFELNGIGYYLYTNGNETAKEELSALTGLLIEGDAPDLGAITPTTIPELREDALTINEARADADFGAYIPEGLPSGFTFIESLRFINQEQNYLRIRWGNGMDYISWKISYLASDDQARITSTEHTENYDLSLYPIPRAESVPSELREIVTDPIFWIDELTREAVMARAYKVNDAGDTSGFRMRFGVLYEDILVEINIKGADPESVYNMLTSLPNMP